MANFNQNFKFYFVEKFIGYFLLITQLAFCSSCSKTPQSTPPKETTLLLDWMPNPNHIPLYAGVKKGFFQEHNIALKIQKPFEAGGGLPYLMQKKTDILLSYMPETLYNCSKGVDIKIVGALFKQPLNAFIFLKDSNIENLADLNQKKLGYCVDNTTVILEAMLKECNIEFLEKRPVQFDILTTLIQKRVDVVYGAYWNIEPSQLEQMGFKTGYLPFSTFNLPNYYELVFLMKKESSDYSEDFERRFKIALQKSIDFCKEFPDEAFKIYMTFHPDFTEKTVKWSKIAWEKTYPILAKDQKIDNEVIEKYTSWLIDKKIIEPFNISALIN